MISNRQIQNVQKESDDVLYPFKDNFSLFLFKKTEKLILAIYLITAHLSEQEPIRQSIRSSTNSLLKDIIDLLESKEISEKSLQMSLLEVNSLLDIGASTCLLSKTNVSMVKEELFMFSKEINSQKEDINNSSLIEKTFFEVDFKKDKYIKDNLYLKRTEVSKGHTFNKINDFVKTSDLKNERDKKVSFVKSIKSNFGKNRIDEILKIVRNKGKVTIKDISAEITDCSEKTIQRELQKLVSENVLNKEGERRWSMYFLS